MDYKISFCTVCMNRLEHLKMTLPKNIKDNLDYPNVEFLVLDYNSQDGMEEWVKKEMMHYIDQGILTYLRVDEPEFFHRSHSRNLAFKAASGDIIVNMDADNYAGKGFATYVNEQFNKDSNIYIIPEDDPEDGTGCYGKVSLKKEDFLAVKGYDEQISGWGFEDVDFYLRLKQLGLRETFVSDKSMLECIEHGILERVCNQKNFKNLHTLFGIPSKVRSELIFLYNDNTFERGTFLYEKPNLNKYEDVLMGVLKEKELIKGTWKSENGQYEFTYTDTSIPTEYMKYDVDSDAIYEANTADEKMYFNIETPTLINHAILLNESTKNYNRFIDNYDNKRLIVNTDFGVAKMVQKNYKEVLKVA